MANPLDIVTQDDPDAAFEQKMRAISIRPANGPDVASGGNNLLTQALTPEPQTEQPWTMDDLFKGLAALKEHIATGEFSPGTKIGNRLFGTGGEERYQTWPEKMLRSGVGAAGNALFSPEPVTSEQLIAPAMDMAGLAGGSALIERPGAATLGSGPVRPAARAMPTTSNTPAPVFYSALEHAATNAAQDVMSPQQWLGYLKNQPGVKQEELAWTGIGDWLGAQKGKVKKEDVQRYLDEHKVEIKDVTKLDKSYEDLSPAELEKVKEDYIEHNGLEHDEPVIWSDVRDHYEAMKEEYPGEIGGDTKYSSYQLPGGENYREHLLTLPERNPVHDYDTAAVRAKDHYESFPQYGPGSWDKLTEAQQRPYVLAAYEGKMKMAGGNYRSSHWDEPNVLAHVRTNDRIMPGEAIKPLTDAEAIAWAKQQVDGGIDGQTWDKLPADKQAAWIEQAKKVAARREPKPIKSLHIEEIQSDWHQQGRKQGYKGVNETPRFIVRVGDETIGRFATREEAMAAAKEYGSGATAHELPKQSGLIPDAPFKTTWPELALKRMIRKAAEGGYDRISWTPGEAQAARYDLSKQIDQLKWYKDGDGYRVSAKKGNNFVLQKTALKPEQLADTVGKEIAEKIVKSDEQHGVMQGLDLKVGGEGMREFYDKMLPKMAEKIGKAHGVKVKQGRLPGNTNVRGGEAVNVPPKEIYETLSEHDPKLKEKFPTIADFVDYYNDLNSEHRADLIASVRSKGTTPIHYFDIPQSLRDHAIGKGFPLYMSGIPFPLVPVDHDPFAKKDKK